MNVCQCLPTPPSPSNFRTNWRALIKFGMNINLLETIPILCFSIYFH
jgi:hypothetical protein